MVAATEQLLDVGLYTPAEAAFYARVQTRLINRWLYGGREGEAVLRPQFESTDAKLLTFLDFVQTLAVREIRSKCRLPLQKIRAGIERARDKYGKPYPLAMEHTTYLYGRELVIRLDEDRMVQVSGRHADQEMMTPIIELYMLDLSFGADRLAREYTAFKSNEYRVTMDPRLRFGEPMLPSCGYSARALWEACIAEGSMQAAAEAYGVKLEEVELAYRYYDHLQGNVAA